MTQQHFLVNHILNNQGNAHTIISRLSAYLLRFSKQKIVFPIKQRLSFHKTFMIPTLFLFNIFDAYQLYSKIYI